MAPEMMQNKIYGESVDWFSFGILLFEMLSGKNPLKNERQEVATPRRVPQRMQEILELEDGAILNKYRNAFSPEAYDLLDQLL